MAIDEALLRRVAADLNDVPGTAERSARLQPLVTEINTRIAQAALGMPFDSTPYAMVDLLARSGKS